jgi:HTH-type transcriptional regulator/antitoxin HigA
MSNTTYIPDIAFHPGETLKEILEEKGMTNKELALRTNKPEKTISKVVNGTSALTPDMAIAFETVLGLPAQFWMNLQRDYDETSARLNHVKNCQDAQEWARQFPYPKMVELGWVPKTSKAEEKAHNLFRFFEITTEAAWEKSYVEGGLRVAARLDLAHNVKKHAITAWLRKGELEVKGVELPSFSKTQLKKIIPELKTIMIAGQSGFFNELRSICASAGVCVILVPSLPSATIHGCSRWINGMPVIQLCERYKRYDRFWFTFFHEIAHVLLHGSKYVSLEMNNYETDAEPKEQEANDWAGEQLFSNEDLDRLKQMDYSNPKVVKKFAQEINTHPCIIVGRLQREKLVGYDDWVLNDLHIQLRLS